MQKFHISNFMKPPLINDLYYHDTKFDKTFEERKEESSKIMLKYPDRIPVICRKTPQSKLAILDKYKYLVPMDLTATQFLYIIRRRLRLGSEQALFLFINNNIASATNTISELYDEHKDKDGFLYVSYTEENVFG